MRIWNPPFHLAGVFAICHQLSSFNLHYYSGMPIVKLSGVLSPPRSKASLLWRLGVNGLALIEISHVLISPGMHVSIVE